MTIKHMLLSSLYILLIPLSAPVGGYCSLPGNCICLPGFSGDNCTEIEGKDCARSALQVIVMQEHAQQLEH